MNLKNSLEVENKLKLTANLKQSLVVLNMSRDEIEDKIKKEANENPLIDIQQPQDIQWETYIKSLSNNVYDKSEFYYDKDKEFDFKNIVNPPINIYEDLKLQINLYKLTTKEKEVCEYIIDSLDKDGYLRIKDHKIMSTLNISNHLYQYCIKKVQSLEPSGICARTLSECLIIQIKNLGINNNILEKVIEDDLNLVSKNKYKDIIKKYNISKKEFLDIIDDIKSLNPKPIQNIEIEKTIYIKPDIIVKEIDDEFVVISNKIDNYQIKINKFYEKSLQDNQIDEDTKLFIKARLNSAKELIRNIQNRENTIIKIAQKIVKHQREFFINGKNHIKPLTMKEIAKDLGYHESTISRGVNDKYMLTPYGMYEFRYFFSSKIKTTNNEEISSNSIKNIIKELIQSENKKKPLSDEKISILLEEQGYNVARRTVTKYRENMKILSSSKRKEY